MTKLTTIQKRENLNRVYSVDEKDERSGTNHNYAIFVDRKDSDVARVIEIPFQKGARNVEGSSSGVIDSDLLEIVRDRLHSFQQGEFSSEYNYQALIHVEEALMWLNRRVEDRIERNVLGKNEK